MPLKIAAKVDAADRDYFKSEIRKLLTPPDVEYIGEISDGEKSSFLSGALALLAPNCLARAFRIGFIPKQWPAALPLSHSIAVLSPKSSKTE